MVSVIDIDLCSTFICQDSYSVPNISMIIHIINIVGLCVIETLIKTIPYKMPKINLWIIVF